MLAPEILDKIRREKEEQENSSLRIPLYLPEIVDEELYEEEKSMTSRVVVIDLM